MGVTDRICLEAETYEICLLASRHRSALVCGRFAVILFAVVLICFALVVFCGNVTVCQKERKVFPSHWRGFFPSVCLAQAVNEVGADPRCMQ